MAIEKKETIALTPEDVAAAGFEGRTYSYPNEFHEASGDAEAMRAEVVGFPPAGEGIVAAVTAPASLKGAQVNGPAKNSPAPTGGKSGPGAATNTSNDDK